MNAASTSFSKRLSLNVVLTTSILFVIAMGIAAVSSHLIIADEAQKSAEHLLDAAVKDIENTLHQVEYAVRNTSSFVEEHKNSPEYMYDIVRHLVEDNDDILGSAVAFRSEYYKGVHFYSPYAYLDESGAIRTKQLGNSLYEYFYMDWYQIPYLLGEPCWSEPYYDEGGAQTYMSTYSYPLKDGDGNVYAVITADISLAWISELLSSIKPYPSSYVSLISRSGSYVNYGDNNRLRGETVFSTQYLLGTHNNGKFNEIAVDMMAGHKGIQKYRIGKKIAFAVYAPMSNGWKASLTCDYRDVLARTSKMHAILILVVLFGLLMLFLLCYYTIRRMTKPLSDFSDSAISIAHGNFNAPLPEIGYDDEIKHLRNSFEFMQNSLTAQIEKAEKAAAEEERMASELNIASKIQMAMLPHDFPHSDKIDLYAMLKPAKEVGGDLYDFFVAGNNLYFTVGDVSGKGVPASMIMAITRSAFRFIVKSGVQMDKVVSTMNDALCDGNSTAMFVTMFVGKLDLETGLLEYCNAGHNPVVVNGRFLDVKPNLAVGLISGFPYQMQSVQLEKGSRIFVYTDGVTEAERQDKEQYGEKRLLESLDSVKQSDSDLDVCNKVLYDVRLFTEGNSQNDDITIMSVTLK